MNQRTPVTSRAIARQPVRSRGLGSPVIAALRAGGRLLVRRPGFILAGVAVAGGVGVFSWNALMKQSGVHPAPLFAGTKPEAITVEPPRRPGGQGVTYARNEPAAAATTKSVADPAAGPKAPADGIGAFLRNGDQPKSADVTASVKPAVDPKANAARIVAVQKALLKVGYGPIGTDGVAGSITRQALERFERDRNLPVTGTLAPRTLKQLASASGVRIE